MSHIESMRSMASLETSIASSFVVVVTGQICSVSFPILNNTLYIRYVISYGPDWRLTHGLTTGISQLSKSTKGVFTFNFPIDIGFESTNAFGWPRISFGVYGHDFLGRDVVRGYGSILIPTMSGRYMKKVQLYRPISGSWWDQITNYIRGTSPEYYETIFTAKGEGREFTRVKCDDGEVSVELNVVSKDMERFGFKLEKR